MAIIAIAWVTTVNFPAGATEISNSSNALPAKIFQANCAGCHIKGGNIIRRGKNLRSRALSRNKLDNQQAIVNLVTNGKNNMPAYSDRLTPTEIEVVSAYVLERAAENWQ